MRTQDFNSGHLKKKKQVINDEATLRQQNLKAKTLLLETEFIKNEHEKLNSDFQNVKLSTEFQVKTYSY